MPRPISKITEAIHGITQRQNCRASRRYKWKYPNREAGPDCIEWQYVKGFSVSDIPRQINGWDCGLYVIHYIQHVIDNIDNLDTSWDCFKKGKGILFKYQHPTTYKTIGSLRVEKIYSIKMILIVTGQNLGTNYQTTIQTSQKTMGVQLKTERETVAPRVGPASDKKRARRLERKGVE